MTKRSLAVRSGAPFLLRLAAASLLAASLVSLAGCSSNAPTSKATDDATPSALLQEGASLGDKPNRYTPDVSESGSIEQTIYLDGDSASTTASESADGEEPTGYTVSIAIDPYSYLWTATGTVTDADRTADLVSVRLDSCEKGHFDTQDVLLSYAGVSDLDERTLVAGAQVRFRYALSDPMRSPLLAYSLDIL